MYDAYINTIKQQIYLKPEDWTFKSNFHYNGILEHVTPEYGQDYLNCIKEKYKSFYDDNKEQLIRISEKNDIYGNTKKHTYEDFTMCSPTNLRYIFHSLLILDYMKSKNLNNVNIIEIGGGYGGLCLFIHEMAPLFKISINSYVIFDLLEPSTLQSKYLDALNITNVKCFQLDNFTGLFENSFMISNYAFSEIFSEYQKQYIDKVINPFTSYGFLTWNHIPPYHFTEKGIINVENEYPATAHGNYYIRYCPPE